MWGWVKNMSKPTTFPIWMGLGPLQYAVQDLWALSARTDVTGIEDRSTMHFRSEFEERSPIAMQKNPGRSSQELPPVPHNVALSSHPLPLALRKYKDQYREKDIKSYWRPWWVGVISDSHGSNSGASNHWCCHHLGSWYTVNHKRELRNAAWVGCKHHFDAHLFAVSSQERNEAKRVLGAGSRWPFAHGQIWSWNWYEVLGCSWILWLESVWFGVQWLDLLGSLGVLGLGSWLDLCKKQKQSRGLGNSNHACDLSLSKDVENPDDNPHHLGKW